VQSRELRQQTLTTWREMNADEPPVTLTWPLVYQAPLGGALDQTYNRVVPLLKKLGQFADCGPTPARVSGDAQQQLMLLRSDACGARGIFAEAQELAHMISNPGKMFY
jgi:hypothetical protein